MLHRGHHYEKLALKFLKQNALKLLHQNFRCRLGEIDLIMQDQQQLVFVEVRYRKSNAYGAAQVTITPTKQQRIIKAAQFYLLQHHANHEPECRFDVIAFNGDQPLDWIKNAFHAS